ncbi:PIR protein [Plasmodium vivax]|nr:PIR protein [Plasmodium vivax]
MDCSPHIRNDSYDFFKNIDNYTNYEENIQSALTHDITQCCTSVMNWGITLRNNERAKNICENFFKIYNILPKETEYKKKNWGFLNYWLNFELGQVNKNICVNEFYDDMENYCFNKIEGVFSENLLYNVKKGDLNKMKLLYGLYENYKKLDNILNSGQQDNPHLLLEFSTKCCTYYVEANYFCKSEDNEFCTQLENFTTKYEGLYSKLNGKSLEYSNNFIKLSECKNTNVISTALIGTTVGLVPLLVGLYKFTPLRQFINSKKGKLTQEYRNNDDQIRNIMLMDHGSEQKSSQQETYNIKYHSV